MPLIAALAAVVIGVLVVGAFLVSRGGGNDTATDDSADDPSTDTAISDPADDGETEEPATTTTAAPTTTAPRTEADITSDLQAAMSGFGQDDLEATFVGTAASLSGTALDEDNFADIEAAALAVEGVESVDTANLLVLPEVFRCTDEIMSQPRWLCLDSAEFDGTTLVATFTSEDGGETFSVGSGFHVHFFNGDVTEPISAGVNGDASTGGGDWQVWDLTPRYETTKFAGTEIEMVCGRVATPFHTLESLDSGNCWPVTRVEG